MSDMYGTWFHACPWSVQRKIKIKIWDRVSLTAKFSQSFLMLSHFLYPLANLLCVNQIGATRSSSISLCLSRLDMVVSFHSQSENPLCVYIYFNVIVKT
jgi:hypothetical protein